MTLQRPLEMQAAGGDTPFNYAAIASRQFHDMVYATEGVVALGLQVTQRGAGANMSVDVATGACVIVGDDVAGQGKYLCVSDAVTNVVVPAAPVSGTRIHRVVARIKDKLHSGSWTTYEWTIELLADTGSGTPATPASAINLARVTVTAGQVTVVNANITDDRVSALLAPARPLQVASDAGRALNPVAGEGDWRTDKVYAETWSGSQWLATVSAETTWTALSLNAQWTNRGAGFPTLQIKKLPGLTAVWVVGDVKWTSNGTTGLVSGATIATVPSGYRPATEQKLSVPTSGGGATYGSNAVPTLGIETDGSLKMFNATIASTNGLNGLFEINGIYSLDA